MDETWQRVIVAIGCYIQRYWITEYLKLGKSLNHFLDCRHRHNQECLNPTPAYNVPVPQCITSPAPLYESPLYHLYNDHSLPLLSPS